MSNIINKIKLYNFKKFKKYVITPNEHINILVGDNETGKSTILEAIELVSSGSIKKIEKIGLEKLLNMEAIHDFNNGIRNFDNLPMLIIELYLSGNFDFTLNGDNNTDKNTCDGIRLICEANEDYKNEINESLNNANYFPYEYYSIKFTTFANESYSPYKRRLKTILINSTIINTEYATNDFIKRTYDIYTEDNKDERIIHKANLSQLKNKFNEESLAQLNERIPEEKNYKFGLKNNISNEFENDLMIYENDISIDNRGTGKQIYIKTDFALQRAGTNIDVILVEEPENHLSYINLKKLINNIEKKQDGQLFITTHNNLISTRLELKNLLIMNDEQAPISLKDLSIDTAKYFVKAPVASIIEFVLSKKVILVEGPSEYMLFDNFYKTIRECLPADENIQIIDIRGLSFKRYLEVACLLNHKVAVVTDNDGDYQNNCEEKYKDYNTRNNCKINYCRDNSLTTFEKVLYKDNETLLNTIFERDNAVSYMLNNKTEAAYRLLTEKLIVPDYIKEAIQWINE